MAIPKSDETKEGLVGLLEKYKSNGLPKDQHENFAKLIDLIKDGKTRIPPDQAKFTEFLYWLTYEYPEIMKESNKDITLKFHKELSKKKTSSSSFKK